MRSVFADTAYWVALANPRDQQHARVKAVSRGLGPCRIVTTEEVLIEFLNYFGERGQAAREVASRMVRRLLANPNARVLPQTRESFLAGMGLYEQRTDKGYSLTDCISMEQMRRNELTEVLTSDHHFRQEGFLLLLTDTGI